MERTNKIAIITTGGIGRIICGIPALEHFVTDHTAKGKEVRIYCHGWSDLFLSNRILQPVVYDLETKESTDWIRQSIILSPEPYHDYEYMNQECNMIMAWFHALGYQDEELKNRIPSIYLSKAEDIMAASAIKSLKEGIKKDKVVIFQPFGSGVTKLEGVQIDGSHRSLSVEAANYLSGLISKHAGVVYLGPDEFFPTNTTMISTAGVSPVRDTRFWASMIANADAFIGIDSMGYHMAQSFRKPGLLINGATFPVNISYPGSRMGIYEKKDIDRKYLSLRLSNIDGMLADRYNESIMEFTNKELDECYQAFLESWNPKTSKAITKFPSKLSIPGNESKNKISEIVTGIRK